MLFLQDTLHAVFLQQPPCESITGRLWSGRSAQPDQDPAETRGLQGSCVCQGLPQLCEM